MKYLRALIDGGFRHLDAVSFVSPKAIPQMADSEEVLSRLSPPSDVEIIGIVVNEKGAERAIATGVVSTLGFPFSISETFLRRNQNQSLEENEATLRSIATRARGADLQVVAYISMAFGNPYGDAWSEEAVAAAAQKIAGFGVASVSLADTIGAADSTLVSRVVTKAIREIKGCEIGVHLHSTRADAASKILAAYDAGCRRFDSAMGGLGGCPFAQNELVGNIPTEEVARALQERGGNCPSGDGFQHVTQMNEAIRAEFSDAKTTGCDR